MTGITTNLHPDFLLELTAMEQELRLPFHITSGYRAPEHNATVGGVSGSAHTQLPCRAVDIACTQSGARFAIVGAALQRGFTRIGIGETFIHLDRDPTKPQSVMWSYYPKKESL